MPEFSIVIPTRDRAQLLPSAIKSALAQDADCEVIVSDNWSADATAEVISGFEGEGVVGIRPDRPLAMHDHWEFAMQKAQGDWVLLLADDDVFCPNLLSSVREVTQSTSTGLISWLYGRYTYSVAPDELGTGEDRRYQRLYYYEELANKLLVPSHTGNVVELDSGSRLRRLYNLENDPSVPRGYTSAVRRDVLEVARGRAGRLFIPLIPDYSCPAVLLACTDSFIFIDAPLQVFGAYPRPEAASLPERFIVESGVGDGFDRLPVPSRVLVTNFIVETLLRARDALSPCLDDIDVDWERYFLSVWSDILWTRDQGIPVDDLRAEFESALAAAPSDLRKAVSRDFSIRHPWAAARIRDAKRSPAAQLLRKIAYRRKPGGRISTLATRSDTRRWLDTIDGERAGFSDILEAATYTSQAYPLRAKVASQLAHDSSPQ